jgi:hypothetical protein
MAVPSDIKGRHVKFDTDIKLKNTYLHTKSSLGINNYKHNDVATNLK